MIAPHCLEDHRARQRLPAVAHQEFEQLILGWLEAEIEIAVERIVRDAVERHALHAQLRRLHRLRLPAQQHLDTRGERLGQIIVAARTQPAHALVHVGQGADHQYRRVDALRAQGADHVESVDIGQHAVERDHVVVAAQREFQALAAVIGAIDLERVRGQFGDDFVGRAVVVLDDEDSALHGGGGGSHCVVPKGTVRAASNPAFAHPNRACRSDRIGARPYSEPRSRGDHNRKLPILRTFNRCARY